MACCHDVANTDEYCLGRSFSGAFAEGAALWREGAPTSQRF